MSKYPELLLAILANFLHKIQKLSFFLFIYFYFFGGNEVNANLNVVFEKDVILVALYGSTFTFFCAIKDI